MTALTSSEARPSAGSTGGGAVVAVVIGLALFGVTILCFLLAPLALVVVVCAGLYWHEKMTKSRRAAAAPRRAPDNVLTVGARVESTPVTAAAHVSRPALGVGSGRPGGVIVVDEPAAEPEPLAMPEWMSARQRRT